jgi:hypothetical protein
MLKRYVRGENFIIRHSLFDIRYSFSVHCKPVVVESPTAKELAKHLRIRIMPIPLLQRDDLRDRNLFPSPDWF